MKPTLPNTALESLTAVLGAPARDIDDPVGMACNVIRTLRADLAAERERATIREHVLRAVLAALGRDPETCSADVVQLVTDCVYAEPGITWREAHDIAHDVGKGAMAALERHGHTGHCAARQAHGDGECECGAGVALAAERASNAGHRANFARAHDALDEAGVDKGGTLEDRIRRLAMRGGGLNAREKAALVVLLDGMRALVGPT